MLLYYNTLLKGMFFSKTNRTRSLWQCGIYFQKCAPIRKTISRGDTRYSRSCRKNQAGNFGWPSVK